MTIIKTRQAALLATAISTALVTGLTPVSASAYEDTVLPQSDKRIVIYFTRHAEKETITQTSTSATAPVFTSDLLEGVVTFTETGEATPSKGDALNEVCGASKCAEQLSKLGSERAMLLADWFARRGVTDKLDQVFATHKIRTQQTVLPTATIADLTVTQLNPTFSELNPESTSPSECATLQAIEESRAAGHDTILIAGHSGTLYDIMGTGVSDCFIGDNEITGLGLDTGNTVEGTGNPDRFPKNDDGKVRDFGDIWKVVITRKGEVRFVSRVNLQPSRLTVQNSAH